MIVHLLLSGLAVFVSARIIPGVVIDGFGTSLVVAIILGVVNIVVKPILLLLTLPVTVLTLGLFTFVVNALMILLVDALVGGFSVQGFGTALLFSLVLSVVGSILYSFTS